MLKNLFFIESIFLVFLLSSYSFADNTEDDSAREKILREYGNRKQYESVVSEREDERIRIKIKTYQQRLKEPLIQNQNSFNALNPIEKERYIERRKSEQESMSQFILKHHNLVEIGPKTAIDSPSKMDEAVENFNDNGIKSNLELEQQLDKELKNLSELKITESMFTKFMSDENKNALFEMLKTNPFSAMSEAEIETMILLRTDGSLVNNFLRTNHKLRDTVVNLIKDKKATPALLSIINRPDALKKYGIACIIVVMIGFFLNLKNSKGGMLKRIFYKIFLGVITLLTNLAIFYLIFEKELTPTISIIKKYYFS